MQYAFSAKGTGSPAGVKRHQSFVDMLDDSEQRVRMLTMSSHEELYCGSSPKSNPAFTLNAFAPFFWQITLSVPAPLRQDAENEITYNRAILPLGCVDEKHAKYWNH